MFNNKIKEKLQKRPRQGTLNEEWQFPKKVFREAVENLGNDKIEEGKQWCDEECRKRTDNKNNKRLPWLKVKHTHLGKTMLRREGFWKKIVELRNEADELS